MAAQLRHAVGASLDQIAGLAGPDHQLVDLAYAPELVQVAPRVATGYRVPGLVERRHSLRSERAAHATARRGRGRLCCAWAGVPVATGRTAGGVEEPQSTDPRQGGY